MITEDINNSHEEINTENEPVLNIKTNLLKLEGRIRLDNPINDDRNYDKAGTNGIFEASPRMVQITGFEIGKRVQVRINVVNKSKFSQRLVILPPSTSFFKIKFSKRGLIPSGLSEVIYLTFLPQKYQYYEDHIKVICEGDKMLIPIHATPKMNLHAKEYVPKYLDFGTVDINSTDSKDILLKNIIDLPFEYEIVPVKKTNEISIEPLMGEINANSFRVLTFKFSPKTYGFFKAEFEFRLSEHGYKNTVITVCGSCNTFDQNRFKKIKNLKGLHEIENDLKTFKHQDTEINISNLEENRIANPNKTDNTLVLCDQSQLFRPDSAKGVSKKFKNFPSNKEREFLMFYNSVETLVKAKDFKYITFIGKKLMTPEELEKFLIERNSENEKDLMFNRKIDLDRHHFEVESKCVVDKNNHYLIKPTFDTQFNEQSELKTRHYKNIFLKAMTKVIVNLRAEKRLNKLKDMITKHNIKSPEDFGDYLDKESLEVFTKDQSIDDYTSNGISLKFIQPLGMSRTKVYLTDEYNLENLKQVIQHENNISLEEFYEYQKLDRHESEVIGYKEFKSIGITLCEIPMKDKSLRPCAENENRIRGERGDPDLSYDKTVNIIDVPPSYNKHISIKVDTMLFADPSVKKYSKYTNLNEASIDYNLQPRKLNDNRDLYSNYSNELYHNLPIGVSEDIKMKELSDENNNIPPKIKQVDKLDLLFWNNKPDDSKIVNVFDDCERFIEMLEKDDEMVKKSREVSKNDIHDQKREAKEQLDNFLNKQKQKWMATLPTVLDNYNSSIVNQNNKFIF